MANEDRASTLIMVVVVAALVVYFCMRMTDSYNHTAPTKALEGLGFTDIKVDNGSVFNISCQSRETSYSALATNPKGKRVRVLVCCLGDSCYVRGGD